LDKERDELIRQLNMFDEWIKEVEEEVEEEGSVSEWTYMRLCDWEAQRRGVLGRLARIPCCLCGELKITYEDENSLDMYCDSCEDIMEAVRAEQDAMFP